MTNLEKFDELVGILRDRFECDLKACHECRAFKPSWASCACATRCREALQELNTLVKMGIDSDRTDFGSWPATPEVVFRD